MASVSCARAGLLLLLPALAACSKGEPEPPGGGRPPPEPAPQAAGQHRKDAIGTKMHRTLAGEPDATGWCLAESSEGAFSVLLPGKFNDFTVTAPAGDGATVTTCIVGLVTEDGRRYSALRASRSDGKMQVDTLEPIAERFQRDGKLKARRPISMLGMSGIEIEAGDERSQATLRCLASGGTLFQMIVECPAGADQGAIAADIGRFFESFKVLEGR